MTQQKARYRITVEKFVDGKLERQMIEESDKDDDDYSDGEKTVGRLLSMIPVWVAMETGCSGLACVAYFCKFQSQRDCWPFYQLGQAYDDWDAEHDFDKCVTVKCKPCLNGGNK